MHAARQWHETGSVRLIASADRGRRRSKRKLPQYVAALVVSGGAENAIE
jgi:hypothetical protein